MLLLSEELIEYQTLMFLKLSGMMLKFMRKMLNTATIEWKLFVNNEIRRNRLSKIAKLILVIPHSNAEEERVFSMVRKNKTPFRPNLDIERTLSSLLTVKLATNEPCHAYTPPDTVINRASKVTWEYNKQHSKNN